LMLLRFWPSERVGQKRSSINSTRKRSSRTPDIAGTGRASFYRCLWMTTSEWLGALSRYNRWMNNKLYGLAATLSDEARKRDCGAFFKSIHGTFNHLLLADKVWFARFNQVAVPSEFMGPDGIRSLDQELYSDFDELHRERVRVDDALSAWVSELTEERLAGPLIYMRRGERIEVPLWSTVLHVFNHQTHHRGQLTTLLMQQGHDPGVTDLFAMLREEAASR
jgi:uncharacterized damage-inducible protein DinB